MLGTYFYHQNIRKTIVAFGNLFNNLYIKHEDGDGNDYSDVRVPLAYGPTQKFLARLEQQADLNKPVAITLPRMSFEMNSIKYDPARKSGISQSFKSSDGNNIKKVFMPVPYNIGFELNIMAKLNEDVLQIIEQILPFFQPAFSVTVDMVDIIGEKKDIPIVLDDIPLEMIMKVIFPPEEFYYILYGLQQKHIFLVQYQTAQMVLFARFKWICMHLPMSKPQEEK
jgi:hypothetical protein